MRAHRMWAASQATGGDSVVAGMWIPAHTTIRSIKGYINMATSTVLAAGKVALGSFAGWVVRINDPDSVTVMSDVWDRQIPKDTTANVMDLDASSTGDTSPFWEPGATVWEETFDIGAQPRKLFQRVFMSSLGLNAMAVNRDPETPFGYEFIGGKTIPINLKGGLYCPGPSLLMFAVGSPLTTNTSVTAAVAALTEPEWGQLQFIDHVLERAMMSLLGLTEAGAETPWDEATSLLRTHLDPQVLELSGGTFVPVTWDTHGELMFEISVEGRMPRRAVDLGR